MANETVMTPDLTLNATIPSTEVQAVTPPVTTAPLTPFKQFATEAEYKSFLDREKQQAVKANEANAQKKAEEAAKLAQMTAEQKMEAQLNLINERFTELNKGKSELAAREVLNKLGLQSEVYADFLPFIVTTDEEETRIKATSIGEKLLATASQMAQKQIQETMKSVTVPAGSANANIAVSDEAKYAQVLKKLADNPKNSQLQAEAFALGEALKQKG